MANEEKLMNAGELTTLMTTVVRKEVGCDAAVMVLVSDTGTEAEGCMISGSYAHPLIVPHLPRILRALADQVEKQLLDAAPPAEKTEH